MSPERLIVRSVEGVFSVTRSEPDPRHPTCLCCKGEHVFCFGIDLPYESKAPGTRQERTARPADWLDRVLYPLREELNGAKVRITLEIERAAPEPTLQGDGRPMSTFGERADRLLRDSRVAPAADEFVRRLAGELDPSDTDAGSERVEDIVRGALRSMVADLAVRNGWRLP